MELELLVMPIVRNLLLSKVIAARQIDYVELDRAVML
jgi:hypothetical protein